MRLGLVSHSALLDVLAFRLLLSACSQPCFCSNRSCFAALTDHKDGADVSPERQQQGELDQEEGGEGGSDGFRDTDDSELDDVADSSEGKGASEDEEDEEGDSTHSSNEDNDRSDDGDYKGSKGIDVFLVMYFTLALLV